MLHHAVQDHPTLIMNGLTSHRHVRYALFFHNLAMVACLRKGNVNGQNRDAYFLQIHENQTFIKKRVLSLLYIHGFNKFTS